MDYTYRFANLLSDADIAEIELSNVKFDRRIIVPGSFSAQVTVTNSDIADQVRKILPGRTIVHVYRGSDIWGSYIIWSVRLSGAGANAVAQLSGASLESWLYRRIIDVDEDVYTNTDQIDIARGLIFNAQIGWLPYESSAEMGIYVAPGGLSGVKRDREYRKTDAATVGQRLEELANVDNGFEYMIRTYVNDDGIRAREFYWGYPGLNTGVFGFEYSYPGNVKSYELMYDATDAATAFWARGDTIESDYTENAVPLMTQFPFLADEYLESSWPHLDKVIDYSSVTELDTLEKYAAYWSVRAAGIVIIPTLEVVSSQVDFHPNNLGAYATFTITDNFFPLVNGVPTFTGQYRIVGMEITPPERGSVETFKFVIESEFDPTEVMF